ncbi:hypothetical protein [Aeromonas caviae]|uniref:hypothetical protein n=1 Tax=Aeromonas caviae TaxID=648 RepID=UPI002B46D87B|nr:hypothetical protein [Aeromonas caviae]
MNRKQDDTGQMARGIGKTHIIVCKQQMLEGIREVMQKKSSQKLVAGAGFEPTTFGL